LFKSLLGTLYTSKLTSF